MRHGVGIGSVELIAGREDVNCGLGGAFPEGTANNSPPFLGRGLVCGFLWSRWERFPVAGNGNGNGISWRSQGYDQAD